MRAHCINVHDADGDHVGDIWISSPWPLHPDRSLILLQGEPLRGGAIALSEREVRQLRAVCDEFLLEQTKARHAGTGDQGAET